MTKGDYSVGPARPGSAVISQAARDRISADRDCPGGGIRAIQQRNGYEPPAAELRPSIGTQRRVAHPPRPPWLKYAEVWKWGLLNGRIADTVKVSGRPPGDVTDAYLIEFPTDPHSPNRRLTADEQLAADPVAGPAGEVFDAAMDDLTSRVAADVHPYRGVQAAIDQERARLIREAQRAATG